MAQLHYTDMEARRQLADVDHDEDIHLQGEGYGVVPDDGKRSPNSSPTRSSEAPLLSHHHRNDAISGTDLSSPPSSYGTHPVTSSFGNQLDLKPKAAGKSLPTSERNESGFDRSGIPKEESMAKELQDQSASGDGVIDVHNLKDNFVDLSKGNTAQQQDDGDLSDREAHEETDDGDCADGGAHEETARLTSQIKTPVDDPKQEEASQIQFPIVDPKQKQTNQPMTDDSKERSDASGSARKEGGEHDEDLMRAHTQSCPTADGTHGCRSFEGEDGREKLSVEGLNMYSGEPENAIYDAEDVVSGQPEGIVNGKDDSVSDMQDNFGSVPDMQDSFGDVTFPKDDSVPDMQDSFGGVTFPKDVQKFQEEPPQNLVHDASYVMGGQPAMGIVIKDDGRRDLQQLEQETTKENGDSHEAKQQEGESFVNVEDDANVFDIQVGGQPDMGIVSKDDGRRDLQQFEQEATKENGDLHEAKQPEDGSILNVEEDANVSDIQEGQAEVRDGIEQGSLEVQDGTEQGRDSGSNVADETSPMGQSLQGSVNVEEDANVSDVQVGQAEVRDGFEQGRNSVSNVADETSSMGQSLQGSLNVEEDANVPDIQDGQADRYGLEQGRDSASNVADETSSMGLSLQESKEGSDVTLVREDKASIADVKSDDQAGMRQVRNPEQGLGVDAMQCDNQPEVPREVVSEDKASIADVKSDEQTGMQQFLNPDQALGVDVMQCDNQPEVPREVCGEDERKLEEDRKGILTLDEEQKDAAQGEVCGEDERKLEEERKGILTLDEEQKDAAQEGEKFILNPLVVDYNSRGLPEEQAAELCIDSGQRKDSTVNEENASTESPYTEFDRAHDYVKVGYGGEDFVPQNNEEVERKLEPMTEETNEKPSGKSMQLDVSGEVNSKTSANDVNVAVQGEGEYERPAKMPHPQPEDLAAYFSNNKGKASEEEEGHEHQEGAPHKKGVLERIKDKLTPPYNEPK